MADAPYFTADELRAAFSELANEQQYTVAKLEAARAFAEQWFEAAAKVAYVRRTVTETVTGSGSRRLFLSRWAEVQAPSAITAGGVDFTADELAEVTTRRYGVLERLATWLDGTDYTVTYQHGYEAPASGPYGDLVVGAVMTLAFERVRPSLIPRRATSISTDVGSYRISQADATGRTGIPDVDAVIGLVGADKPAVG